MSFLSFMTNSGKEIMCVGLLTTLSILSGIGCDSASLRGLPDLSLTTIKGQQITRGRMKGHPLLITFWATDCGPCLKEIPSLVALHNEFAGQGLIIVAIAMYYDPPNQVVNFVEKRKLPYSVVLDPQAKISQAFGQIKWTPTNFLFAPNGKLTLKKRGAFHENSIRNQIRELIHTG